MSGFTVHNVFHCIQREETLLEEVDFLSKGLHILPLLWSSVVILVSKLAACLARCCQLSAKTDSVLVCATQREWWKLVHQTSLTS